MFALLNIGSFILGLVAWILPYANLMLYKNPKHKNWAMLSILSLSACALSLFFQMLYNNHLVQIEDWSALLDITDTIILVSFVLLVVTIALNVITLVVYRKR